MTQQQQHVCNDACGIDYDPLCPLWPAPGLTPEEVHRRKFVRDIGTLLEAHQDLVKPMLLDWLRQDIEALVESAVARRLASRRKVRHGRS